MSIMLYATLLIASLTLSILYLRTKRRVHNTPLPPGPPPDPLIGHSRIIPTKDHPEIFYEWSKTYGDVMHLNALGHSFVILGSEQAAIDLLEQRGANYSERPYSPMHDLIGWGDMLVFQSTGEQFNRLRRLSQQPFTRQGVLIFRDIQIHHMYTLLHNLTRSPQSFYKHVQKFSAAVIVEIAYGHRIIADNDPYLQMVNHGTQVVADSGNLGVNILDIFPILKNLPAWFPGAWFISFGIESQKYVQKARHWPFQDVKEQLAAGTAKTSFVSLHLEEFEREGTQGPEEIKDLKTATLLLNQAGAETTSSSILLFIFSMLIHPDALKKAQEEIDRVVGHNRLPDFSDRESLPMVECVMQENFRWHQPVPLGIPHCSREDDVYRGMFIPKGSIVIPNAVSMGMDENIYANPHMFWPERYLPKPAGNGEPHPASIFGFGRRACPGRYLADASIWLAMVNIMATFEISFAQDAYGKSIVPPREYITGATRRPKPFICQIRPRGAWAEKLIQQAYQDSL
ncbi:hypothetical protein NLI96_g265 [Meripilus lineatus]|uniref:Cytochrome P450 n=1 Tax=Meripilus lineatus TaxID=2056292 RepID=A0AAD5VCP6_9APHY|nr:hypothetical protein NLI96_g265 [Physisporinus lineatus]